MRKAGFILILLVPVFTLLVISFDDSIRYHSEIKKAYGYVDPVSQKTIKYSTFAQVEKEKITLDTKIQDKQMGAVLNIKGKDVLIITFKTKVENSFGPIRVYLDNNTGEVLGVGIRK